MPLDRRAVGGLGPEGKMSDLVTVGNYFDRFQAEIAQSILESEGIDSYIRADDAGGMRPFLQAGSGGAWLIVGAADAVRASELLQAFMQEQNEETSEAEPSAV